MWMYLFVITIAFSIHITTNFSTMNSLGEGCTSIMGGTEVPPGTKVHEHWPSQEYAPHSSVAKRSYKRAINRIAKHGFTWYHGALLTHQHVSASQIPIPRSSPTQIPCEPNVRRHNQSSKNTSFAKQRFSCMSWMSANSRLLIGTSFKVGSVCRT